MAQLDRLLSHLASKGAVALQLEPHQPPMLEAPDKTLTPMLPTPVPPILLEHLVKEILPPEQEECLALRGEASFIYRVGGQSFSVIVNRGHQGLSLRAEPSGASLPPQAMPSLPTPAPAPVSAPASAPAPAPAMPPVPIPVQVQIQIQAPTPMPAAAA